MEDILTGAQPIIVERWGGPRRIRIRRVTSEMAGAV